MLHQDILDTLTAYNVQYELKNNIENTAQRKETERADGFVRTSGYAGSASFAASVIYITALTDMQCPKITALFAGAAAAAGAAANLRLDPLMHS